MSILRRMSSTSATSGIHPSMSTPKQPIHRLPRPRTTLQNSLPQLTLDDAPVAQRRSTTFKPSTPGVWARVNPLWTAWPLRLTKQEVEAMGIDVDGGEQVSVSDVLARWDPTDAVAGAESSDPRRTSNHRLSLSAHILGISSGALEDDLPHLDVGDALAIASGEEAAEGVVNGARAALVDVISGRHVIAADGYGPWSTRYCGHQFGVWAGQLGDGRAISVLETVSDRGGRQEIQLKGAGRTPFSRHADGLAVLRSGVREYLGGEAIAALQIPTTRSLALLTADALPVIRETGPEPSSLLARTAPSFIRIGHFEALSPGVEARKTRQIFIGGAFQDAEEGGDAMGGQGNLEGLRRLSEWCAGVMSELRSGSGSGNGASRKEVKGARELFGEVVRRNAEMVAGWQVYGFCHGVINTDNVSVLGLTIDYGPYAFQDIFDQGHICNHSDPTGLYNYRNQPARILFALDKLHEALAPLIGYEMAHGPAAEGWAEGKTAEEVRGWTDAAMRDMQGWEEGYWKVQRATERAGWLKRFGLRTSRETDDREIMLNFLTLLNHHSMDFHSSFRHLARFSLSQALATSTEQDYVETFAAEVVAQSSLLRSDGDKSEARAAWVKWLEQYAARASEPDERDAWGTSGEEGASGSQWETARRTGMQGVNPRFVLRQWVLEELIKEMETALAEGDEAGRMEARAKLSRVLRMSANPFLPYGEEGPEGDEEERRLCGLGGRNMIGFQCSCSS